MKIINGKIITINAYIFDNVKIVKKRIQDKEGIPDFGLVSYIIFGFEKFIDDF